MATAGLCPHFAAGKFEVYNGQIEVRFWRMKSPVARARLNRLKKRWVLRNFW